MERTLYNTTGDALQAWEKLSGDEQYNLLNGFAKELTTVYIVSGVKLEKGVAPAGSFTDTESGMAVLVEPADGCRCDRCWIYAQAGKKTEDGFLCDRCLGILEA